MVKTISVQELRVHLPQILEEVGQGVRFLLIWHSKPVGELKPIGDVSSLLEGSKPFEVFARPTLKIKARKSAVKLAREERS